MDIINFLLNYPIVALIIFIILRGIFSKKKDATQNVPANKPKSVTNPNTSQQQKNLNLNQGERMNVQGESMTLQELLAKSIAQFENNKKNSNQNSTGKSNQQITNSQPNKNVISNKSKKASEYDFKPVGTMNIESESDKNYDTQAIDYDISAADYDISAVDYDKNRSAFEFKKPINEPEAVEYHQGDYGFHQIHGLTDADRQMAKEEMKAYEEEKINLENLNWVFSKENIYKSVIFSEILGKPKGVKNLNKIRK